MTSSLVLAPSIALRCPRLAVAAVTIGTVDLVACSVFWFLHDVPPTHVIKSLASWVIGADAYTSAGTGVPLGFVVLYTVAALWVLGYQAASQRLPALLQAPLRSGAVYGALLFALMHWIVVPMSAAPVLHTGSDWLIALLSIHVVLIGMPCGLFARWVRDPRQCRVSTHLNPCQPLVCATRPCQQRNQYFRFGSTAFPANGP